MSEAKPLPPAYLPPGDPVGDGPFAGDLFERQDLGQRLTELVARCPHGCVLAIDAEWGDGKTWFGRNWQRKLDGEGFKTAYVDAFQQDYVGDPFVMLAAEMLGMVQGTAKRPMAAAVRSVSKAIAPIAGRLVIAGLGKGLLGDADIADSIKTQLDEAANEVAKAAGSQITASIKSYEADRNSIDKLRQLISSFASDLSEPIVFIVDELDRCKPPFAVATLERIKHFFSVPGIVFVLLMNRSQLEAAIRGVYGESVDADRYLRKFLQFTLTLPSIPQHNDESFRHRFCEKKLKDYGFTASVFCRDFSEWGRVMDFSFRDVEQGVSLYALASWQTSDQLVSWLIALKIARPNVIKAILSGDVGKGHDEALKVLDRLKPRISPDIRLDALRSFHHLALNPDHKLQAAALSAVHIMHRLPKLAIQQILSRIDLAVQV